MATEVSALLVEPALGLKPAGWRWSCADGGARRLATGRRLSGRTYMTWSSVALRVDNKRPVQKGNEQSIPSTKNPKVRCQGQGSIRRSSCCGLGVDADCFRRSVAAFRRTLSCWRWNHVYAAMVLLIKRSVQHWRRAHMFPNADTSFRCSVMLFCSHKNKSAKETSSVLSPMSLPAGTPLVTVSYSAAQFLRCMPSR